MELGGLSALPPKLDVDSRGNALLLFAGAAGDTRWSARWIRGLGWQAPLSLPAAVPYAAQSQVVVHEDGAASAIWMADAEGAPRLSIGQLR